MTPATLLAERIRPLLGEYRPKIAIILGSGLGPLAEQIKDPVTVSYREIKDFPQSTVPGHDGALIAGRLNGTEVLCLRGRFHLYEGYAPQLIKTVIQTLRLLGITTLIVTNAAGSLRMENKPGSLLLIRDHINFSGFNPLIGPNDEIDCPRFPDMSCAYDARYRGKMTEIAQRLGIPLSTGVYLMVSGPCFETPAEIKAFQTLGADATGMSTVPEVICAVHAGIRVLGMSVLTNYGTGMTDCRNTHAETLSQAGKAAADMTALVSEFVREIANG